MADTTDLYTTVKNISGVAKFFGYVGPRGAQLASNATATIYGSIHTQKGFNKRKQEALERDLLAAKITILKTPVPIIDDTAPAAALANPSTTATIAATGGGASGGLLAAGTYQATYTFVNTWGETLEGGRSATVTVGATNIPRVTLPALPGNATSISLYLTAVNVPAGTPRLYKTGITGTTTDLSVLLYTNGTLSYAASAVAPTTNTTDAPESVGVKSTAGTLGTLDPSWGRYAI